MEQYAALIDQILNDNHTESEWFDLEKQWNAVVAALTGEELESLTNSGAGEMLYMICSGFRFQKEKGNV